MINYPNALQPPPSGITLPDRFLQLTQATNANTEGVKTNATNNGTIDGTNSTLSISPVNVSLSSSPTNTLLIDPHSNSSTHNLSIPTNVGQHVLNDDGEVDGSDIGLGKNLSIGEAATGLEPENQGLSAGAIAGVSIGGLAAFAILVAMGLLVRKIRRNSREKKSESIYISDNASSSMQYIRDSRSLY